MRRNRAFAIIILALAAAIGLTAVIVDQLRPTPRGTAGVTTSESVSIGGDFTLTDHTGRRVTAADFHGQYLLIYFGYTFCPDVCPTELQDMATVMDLLGDKAAKVTPVFITIDPARDGVEQMRDYVEAFHPRMVGLTGTEAEIAAAANAYRVYYAKAADPDSNGQKADDEYYLMDHSSFIYFMGPDGKNVAIFNGRAEVEAMAADIAKVLGD